VVDPALFTIRLCHQQRLRGELAAMPDDPKTMLDDPSPGRDPTPRVLDYFSKTKTGESSVAPIIFGTLITLVLLFMIVYLGILSFHGHWL
jgi:hypothetical protein